MTTVVKYFMRPNGELYEIVELEIDERTSSLKIVLENTLSRWFKLDELVIVPPVIRMKNFLNDHI
jgi:hypothetical protein